MAHACTSLLNDNGSECACIQTHTAADTGFRIDLVGFLFFTCNAFLRTAAGTQTATGADFGIDAVGDEVFADTCRTCPIYDVGSILMAEISPNPPMNLLQA